MKSLEDNKLAPVAMQIILHAGDAREKVGEALAFAKRFEFAMAREALKQANAKITDAHHAQTDVIQEEMEGGEREELVLIFVHAQDTLMTIRSEVKLAAEMIDMFEIVAKRIDEKA